MVGGGGGGAKPRYRGALKAVIIPRGLQNIQHEAF